ncbi:ribosomal protection-like ABC-F family protein [Fulvivirga sedimenti]|uniref:ATP-binding cassette domain-containing protein n=1 Tax=Fulvivirga sedimenti TaxID=2879465 RepID=A0A9X1KZD5_9BACT|nr:ABC-F family ATP-binding cassette domain-containing protein [Fulvivirga sedimenti]MCA6074935.1 ATP-binding cassette domain-containing protein [Fulvivirga sedimenti]MCA6076112.1 ATP-binding cassette domain-containing protein [Fulvivirga sedimenti]MCA6077240.1 ATP-binding cassette domain-containing protein [Fulvivirga sedimenti]
MLAINNLSYFIGGRALYQNAALHIKPKDKIGLIGLNGKGKSTLLKLINGDYQADEGEISKSNECTVGFLNQDLLSYLTDDSILTVAMTAFGEAVDTQRRIEKILKKLETEYSDELIDKLTKLQEKFERLEGYSMQAKAEEILEGIGFRTEDLHRPLKQFSGGWRMRVMLAKLLLEKPSLLMLDEPTNHLDLPSIEWVENYIRNYEGAVIIVSHDRQFLNNTVSRIVEVSQEQLISYEGNYDFYMSEKELRSEIQKNAFENQQQKIKQTERFIERFRAKSTKARQVQSRVKALERMDRVEDVIDDTAAVNFKFKFKQKSGRYVMRLHNISKAYGDLSILKNTSAIIERGDKIALIGANGKGKSTLLRIISGTEMIEGEREEGYNVIEGFYAQHQLEALHVNNEILEELKQAGSDKTELELRQILGCFLFSDDDVFKKIKVLSGGEKSRVALAKTLISEANFLLLDEPTNHLDFISENILIQALQQYQGTFVVVSHNRHFISEVANKIWYIEDEEIKEYPGTYQEYLYWRNEIKMSEQTEPAENVVKKEPVKKERHREPEDQKELKKLQEKLSGIEDEIAEIESEIEMSETHMAKPEVYADPDALSKATVTYEKLKSKVNSLQDQWEDVAGKIDELEQTS